MMHQVISLCFSVQGKRLNIQYVKPCGHQKRTNKTSEIRLKLFNAPVCMYCFLFFHLGCKFSQVSAGSSAKPWMPLDSQQPNSHCYWLTTYSELLCVCSHSHLHWYETAQTQELGRGRPQGTVVAKCRQAGSVGRYHPSFLPHFLMEKPSVVSEELSVQLLKQRQQFLESASVSSTKPHSLFLFNKLIF